VNDLTLSHKISVGGRTVNSNLNSNSKELDHFAELEKYFSELEFELELE